MTRPSLVRLSSKKPCPVRDQFRFLLLVLCTYLIVWHIWAHAATTFLRSNRFSVLVQAFEFQQYKDRGPVTLATDQAEAMLKSMESSQVVVTAMLTSPYIGPLKEDARAWEAKLSKLIDILEKVSSQYVYTVCSYNCTSHNDVANCSYIIE